jgi:hypothetical protein
VGSNLAVGNGAVVAGTTTLLGDASVGGSVAVAGDLRVGGAASVGVILRSCTPNAAIFDCSCLAGETVIGGGGWAALTRSLRESRPLTANTWRVTCVDPGGADVPCDGVSILCARLAP